VGALLGPWLAVDPRESDIAAFAAEAGFEQRALLLDSRGWFADALWRAGGREA
jgi:hypothetical protein